MGKGERVSVKKGNARYVKLWLTGVAVIAAGLLCFFVLYRFSAMAAAVRGVLGILSPFLFGGVLAYLLSPACGWFEGRLLALLPREKRRSAKLARTLSILLTLLAAVLVLCALLLLVVPQVCWSVIEIVSALPGQLVAANNWLHTVLKNQPELQVYWDSLSSYAVERLNSWMQTDLLPTAQTLLTGLGGQLAGAVALLKNLLLGLIVSVYLLAGRKRFAAQAKLALHGIFPAKWAGLIEEEVRYADQMFSGFLIGKLLDSAIIGVICFAVTALMGFQSALLVSVVVGVTNVIPFFGPFIGAIPCAVLLLLENPLHCLSFIIFIVILQQVDGNIIGPKILGNSTGLSSFWVLFAILLFGGLWGFFGMIVGVPLFAVIYDIARRLIFYLLKKRDSQGLIKEYSARFADPPPQEAGGRKEDGAGG